MTKQAKKDQTSGTSHISRQTEGLRKTTKLALAQLQTSSDPTRHLKSNVQKRTMLSINSMSACQLNDVTTGTMKC